jgi:hypothetical protein
VLVALLSCNVSCHRRGLLAGSTGSGSIQVVGIILGCNKRRGLRNRGGGQVSGPEPVVQNKGVRFLSVISIWRLDWRITRDDVLAAQNEEGKLPHCYSGGKRH